MPSKTTENKICQNCKKDFSIEPNDLGFYEKVNVPAPTFCPACRRQRRWAWRNKMSLYSRICDLCKKSTISAYALDSGVTIYCNKCWWGDGWDPKKYAVDYDFSKPFFTQYKELLYKIPQIAVVNDDGIASVNCEYTYDWWFSKDCYMCFSGWHVQNVMYSFFILQGRDIMDCNVVRSKSENLYECFLTSGCYNVKYSQVDKSCIDSQFLFDCIDCKDCFMCVNLRGKKYYFKNKQYEKVEYEKILASYKLDTFSGVEKAQKEYQEFILKYPRRFLLMFRSLNSLGEILSDSKNVKNCFVIKGSENCRYCDFAGDAKNAAKDSYDLVMSGGVSESYEGVVMDNSQLNRFGVFSVKSQDMQYTQHCHSSKHLFGCVGLRNASYCIFNKQYTKDEYEALVPKIIEHMNAMPFVDKAGNSYKYGEFFPIEMSPYGYNETYAEELNPMAKEEIEKKGYKWQASMQKTTDKETLIPENIPDSINEVTDNILEEVLKCTECDRNYKITKNELAFYKKLIIPIPRKCFYCRYEARLAKSNALNLWHRQCMCAQDNHTHKGLCPIEFQTSYAPERSEIVYCEKCYQAEVY